MTINPYYQSDGITIYCGDCREIIPELPKVDLVLTDPPYGLSYNNGDLAHRRESVFGGNKDMEASRPIENDENENGAYELLKAALSAIKPKMVNGACCCCCCGGGGPKPLFARWSLLLDEIIGFKHAVVWDKGGLGMGLQLRRNYEFVLIAQKGNPTHAWNGGNNTPNIWHIPKIIPSANQHPTEKPVALMKKCIDLYTNPGDLVVDVFAGTGATLVAAKQMGRQAVGIEIEEKYCEIAVKRLAQKQLAF